MRKLISKIVIFGSVLGVSGQVFSHDSQAGFLVEPLAGYSTGALTNEGTSHSFNGFGFGGRAGVTFAGLLFVAADVKYIPGSFTQDGTDASVSGNLLNVGGVLGVNPPALPLRAWVGYTPLSNLKTTLNGQDSTIKGNGIHAGIGYSVIPMVSLNIEYYHLGRDESETAGGATQTLDLSQNLFMFSLSVPLSI